MWYIKRVVSGKYFASTASTGWGIGYWTLDRDEAAVYSTYDNAKASAKILNIDFPNDPAFVFQIGSDNNAADDYDRAMRGI